MGRYCFGFMEVVVGLMSVLFEQKETERMKVRRRNFLATKRLKKEGFSFL